MTVGIYCYRDLKNDGEIIYIGKDSNINKKWRYHAHKNPSCYNQQVINRIIQNNPKRYEYSILKSFREKEHSSKLLEALEIIYIKRYNPKFNFTKGGEGRRGFKLPKKAREKLSKNMRGKNNHRYGVSPSDETRKKMSDAHKGRLHGPMSEETKHKISEAKKKKNPSLVKKGFRDGIQQYGIVSNGVTLKVSINFEYILNLYNQLINNEITEKDILDLRKFKYTVVKHGYYKNGLPKYLISKKRTHLIQSYDKSKLEIIADALNKGVISDDDVKAVHGVKRVLELINNANST